MNNKAMAISRHLRGNEAGRGLINPRPAWVIRVPRCPSVASMSVVGETLVGVGWDGSGGQALLAASLVDGSTIWTRDDIRTHSADTNPLLLGDRLVVDAHVLRWPDGELLDAFSDEADRSGFERSLLLGGAGDYALYEMCRDDDDQRVLGIYDAAARRFFLRHHDFEEPGIFFEQGRLLGALGRKIVLYDFVNDQFVWQREVQGPTAGSHGIFCDGTAAYVVSGEGQLLRLSLETGDLLARAALPDALRSAEDIRLSIVGGSDALYIHKGYPRPSVACACSLPEMRLLWEAPCDDWNCFSVSGDVVYVSIETWAQPSVLRAHDRYTGALIREFVLPLKPHMHIPCDDRLVVHDMHGQIACFVFEEPYRSPHKPG